MTGRTVAITALLLAAGLGAQQPSPVTFTPLEGAPWSGELLDSGDDGTLRARTADGAPRTVVVDELESIECGGKAELPSAGPGRVWLRSGPEFGARVTSGARGEVQLELGFAKPGTFQLAHLRALRFEAASAAGDYDGFVRALATPTTTDDLLFAWNRQSGKLSRLSVHVLGVSADGVTVDYRGEKTVPLDQVHGLVFGTDNGFRPPALRAPTVTVVAGTAEIPLAGTLAAWRNGALTLRLAEGVDLDVPTGAIRRVDVASSRVRRLVAADAIDVAQTAALDTVRPWLVNRAPGGAGLVLGDQTFTRGLCLFPRTKMSWTLEPGAFATFVTTIGIDARSTGPADAAFRVALDDTLVFERPHMRAGDVESIHLDLGDARKLTVEVDFGANLDLGDHCVFADPRLTRR